MYNAIAFTFFVPYFIFSEYLLLVGLIANIKIFAKCDKKILSKNKDSNWLLNVSNIIRTELNSYNNKHTIHFILASIIEDVIKAITRQQFWILVYILNRR